MSGRWNRPRGLGTALAAIIMVVVIVVVGAGSYYAFTGSKSNGGTTSQTPPPSCSPPTSPICGQLSGGHDLFMSVPYRSVSAGIDVPFTAAFSGTGKIANFLYNFGDGSPILNSSSSTVHHAYAGAGTYIASVQGLVAGQKVLHDNWAHLLIVSVNPNAAGSSSFEVPQISGLIVKNSSSAVKPTAVLDSASSNVNFNGSYTAAPTDPNSAPLAPTLTVPTNATVSAKTSGSTFVNATYTFSAAGIYVVTMVGGGTVGGTTYYQNYTWTVFVSTNGFHPGWISGGSGNNAGGSSYTGRSPHAGSLQIYELVPGAARSLDPAVDYDTQGFEPIENIYQTLIAYNGSQTGATYVSYVPQLATCVPGSPACQSLYGSTLISSDGGNWTFVLSPTAQFYDPHNGNHWGVYPSDVMFSVARTLGFATGIGIGATAGWIISQALMNHGNGAWDSMHGYFNNTADHILSSMAVNDSAWCPASAMSNAHGCITFHATGLGQTWPYFLEFISDGLGAGIVPCGYFSATAQGAAIPGWTDTSANQGDHPCTLPGGATSTNTSAFQTAVAAYASNPKGWDAWETAGAGGSSGTYPGNTQYNPAGSGPYYLKQFLGGAGYLLAANPSYVAPCSYTGCQPAPGTYAKSVSVTWENSATPGEQAYKSGIADQASVPLPDLSLLLGLVNGGTVQLISFPTISIYFFPMDLSFNLAGAQALVSNVNVPGCTTSCNFLSYDAVRQFLVHAYPYQTIQNTIQERDGLTFDINYGGAIPISMQFNQQTTINWPSGDPTGSASQMGSAAWWWAQATNASNPTYYDPQLASCTTGSPCVLPMIGENGAPDVDERIAAWAADVASISGGRLTLGTADVNFGTLVQDSTASPPGGNPLPMFQLGWAPDYPDATDYVNPMYLPNNTYTFSDAVAQQLSNVTQGFNSSSCHNWADYAWWAGTANNMSIPEGCQGSAYAAMTLAIDKAATLTDPVARNLLYYQAESIANGLALYVYWGQSNIVESYASWLLGSSFNENITIGGGNANLWYTVVYAATGNGASD